MLYKALKMLGLLVLTVTTICGQATTGVITGVVMDSTRSAVPGAKLTATSHETGATQTTQSNDSGTYRLNALPVGTYKLTAEKDGFSLFAVDDVVLNTASTLRVDVNLSIAGVTQAVEVSASAQLLVAETVTGSQVVNNVAVQNFPLLVNGGFRDPLSLAALTPGVSTGKVAGSPSNTPSISGGRGWGAEVLLDGSPNVGYANSISNQMAVAMDSVAEFKVLTSIPPAEYGRTDGGIITMVSKSGTRELHGGVSELMRNDIFDSRPFFATQRSRVRQHEFGANLGGPVYIPKIYAQRERTFFFVDYNGFRRADKNGGQFRTLPTDAMRQGNFSEWPRTIYDPRTNAPDGSGGVTRTPFAGNVIPQDRLDTLALKMQNLYPHANLPGVTNNYNGTQIQSVATDAYFIKINHDIAANNRLTVSYRVRTSLTQNQGVLGRVLDGNGYPPPGKWWNFNIADDHIITPNLLNHFSFGFGRVRLIGQPSTGADIGIQVPGAFGPGRPNVFFTGPYTVGSALAPGFSTIYRMEGHNNFDWQDSLSWTIGKHSFKWGIRVGRGQVNERPTVTNEPGLPCWDCPGSYGFSNLGTGLPNASNRSLSGNDWASFLVGFADTAQASQYPGRGWRGPFYAGFFQDDYKITSKLTVNAGLRWELNQPFYEVAGRMITFNLTKPNPGAAGRPGAVDYFGTGPGRVGTRNFLESYKKGFGPRLGLAYQFEKNTVFRAGAAILYSPQRFIDSVRFPLKNGFDNFAFSTSTDVSITPALWLSQGFSPSQISRGVGFGGTPNPALLNGRDAAFYPPEEAGRNSVSYQYTAAIQHIFPSRISVDVSYIGTIGKHLTEPSLIRPNQLPLSYLSLGNLLTQNINSPAAVAAGYKAPYAGFQGTVAQSLRAYPQVLNMTSPAAPVGNSTYHALQLKVEKTYSQGLQFSVAYTASKSISDSDPWAYDARYLLGSRDQYNRRLDKSITLTDTPQRMVIGVVYDFPMGPGKRFLSRGGLLGQLTGGWSVSGIFSYQSGTPVYVFAPNTMGIFSGLQTANQVPGQPALLKADIGSFDAFTDRYVNPAGFVTPPNFKLGTLGRVLPNVRIFPTRNEDFNIIKRFAIHEKIRAELQFSMFNAFNRHIFGAPNLDITSPAFGTIRTAQTPRTGQIGAKVQW